MSVKQAELFTSSYQIIYQQPNTTEGFSATLFRNRQSGEYTLAVRGTESDRISDLISDVGRADIADIGADGIAVSQALDLFNYYQILTARQGQAVYRYTLAEQPGPNSIPLDGFGWVVVTPVGIAAADGVLTDKRFTVAGHSLGGHLALIMQRLAPAFVDAVYTYNAPGLDTGLIPGNDNSERFFNALSQAQVAATGATTLGVNGFAIDRLHNLAVPLDVISDIGNIPGDQTFLFSEVPNPPIGWASAHSIARMTDSLAVYDLLGELDPNLDPRSVEQLLEAGSNRYQNTLEATINDLGALFGADNPVATDNRDQLYQAIEAIRDTLLFQQAAGCVQVLPLTGMDPSTVAATAGVDSAEGIAYRYALRHLVPFAIVGDSGIYASHNALGELDLFDPESGGGTLTTDYLADRAAMLQLQNRIHRGDLGTGSVRGVDRVEYHDRETDLLLNTTVIGPLDYRAVIFDGNSNLPLIGGTRDDRLYGASGDDELHGNGGDDYLEGGPGDDILRGGAGKGDLLDGGPGFDRYLFAEGDQQIRIRDVDGTGRIQLQTGGNLFTLGGIVEGVNGADGLFHDDHGIRYSMSGSELHISPAGGGKIIVEDFSSGMLGIELRAADMPEPRSAPPVAANYRLGVHQNDPSYDLGSGDSPLLAPSVEEQKHFGPEQIQAAGSPLPLADAHIGTAYAGRVAGGMGDSHITGDAGFNWLIDDLQWSGGFGTEPSTFDWLLNDPVWDPMLRDGAYFSLGAQAGNDVLRGGGGGDWLFSSGGDDWLFGEDGNDFLLDNPGTSFGDDRWWRLPGSSSNDRLYGGAGDDWLMSHHGEDLLIGEDGDDLLLSGAQGDQLSGGPGDDWLLADTAVTDRAWPQIGGLHIPNVISAGEDSEQYADDRLFGGDGQDQLVGGGGSDLLFGGEGGDSLWGDGAATIAYSQQQLAQAAQAGSLTASVSIDSGNAEIAGDDQLYGEGGDDFLIGMGGSDFLDGGEGNDRLFGDHDPASPLRVDQWAHGDDSLIGGAGSDWLYGNLGGDYLSGGTDPDWLYGGVGADHLEGGAGNDYLFGEEDDDRLYGGDGADQLMGGEGDDELRGGLGSDQLQGGDGDDHLSGGAGIDQLSGQRGNDRLAGGEGADILSGGDGDDLLLGGAGSDRLQGGNGSDLYVFHPGHGVDLLDDRSGKNRLHIELQRQGPVRVNMMAGTDGAGYLVLGYGDSDQVLIKGGFEGAVQDFAFGADLRLSLPELVDQKLSQSLTYHLDEPGVVMGGGAADTLVGSVGSDLLLGQGGDDTLAGSAGDDRLQGGAGNDTYLIGPGSGRDRIMEVPGGIDTLKLLPGINIDELIFRRAGDDLLVQLPQRWDGVAIDSFFRQDQAWRIEDAEGREKELIEAELELDQAVVAPPEIERLWQDFSARILSHFDSLVLTHGYRQAGPGVFERSYITKTDQWQTDQYYRLILSPTELEVAQTDAARSLGDGQWRLVSDRTERLTSEETRFDTGGASFVASKAPTGGYLNPSHPGSSSMDPGADDVWVAQYGDNEIWNPLTGTLERELQGYWVFPQAAPSTHQVAVERDHRVIEYNAEANLVIMHAGAEDNRIDLSAGRLNLVDGGAGRDVLDARGEFGRESYEQGGRLWLPQQMLTRTRQAPGSLLYGNAGDDILIGAAFEDLLIGGSGNDLLAGGGGNDSYHILHRGDWDRVFDDGWVSGADNQGDLLILPAGIQLSDLSIQWGETLAESLYPGSDWWGRLKSIHTTLDLSWSAGEGVSIILPHSEQMAGTGIDFIAFGDGSRLSIEQLMMQADGAPGVDPHQGANILSGFGRLSGGAGDDVLTALDPPTESPFDVDLFPPIDAPVARRNAGLLVGGQGRDRLAGSRSNDLLLGGRIVSDQNLDYQRLLGSLWDPGNHYRGGGGEDEIWLTAGDDIIAFDIGDGRDLVTDLLHDPVFFWRRDGHGEALGSQTLNGALPGWRDVAAVEAGHWQQLMSGVDRLQFGPGIRPADIRVRREDSMPEWSAVDGGMVPRYSDLVFFHVNGQDEVRFRNWFKADVNQLNLVSFNDGTDWNRQEFEYFAAAAFNRPPAVRVPIAMQSIEEGSHFSFQLPGGSFSDPDQDDSLDYSARLADGSELPFWLEFHEQTLAFSGAPPLDAAGHYPLEVTATDAGGLSAVSAFELWVQDSNPPLVGGEGEDQLIGGFFPDDIRAGGGDDLLLGQAGADRLDGGFGSDLLQGGPGDDSLLLSGDGIWSSRFIAYNAGSPGHPGSREKVVIDGKLSSHDVMQGGEGWDIVVGTGGDDAVFLDDRYSPFPKAKVPRLTGVEEFRMGEGNDIVDLTSTLFEAGAVTLKGGNGDDVLWSSAGDDRLFGEAGDDRLFGGWGDDVLAGGDGSDLMQGWDGNDLYLFGRGDGQDRLTERGGSDTLRFGPGISAEQLWFQRAGDDLLISVIGSEDGVTVDDWYGGGDFPVERFEVGADRMLPDTGVHQLVTAMAAFNPPAAGETTLSATLEDQLLPVITAAWHTAAAT